MIVVSLMGELRESDHIRLSSIPYQRCRRRVISVVLTLTLGLVSISHSLKSFEVGMARVKHEFNTRICDPGDDASGGSYSARVSHGGFCPFAGVTTFSGGSRGAKFIRIVLLDPPELVDELLLHLPLGDIPSKYGPDASTKRSTE
jgi:hypothetical protein